MVLKRILVTTLSALGLGALVAGTASGQTAGEGNIPAPDIFDDQITCSMNVPAMAPMPTQIPMGGMTSPLDDIIGMGDRELNTTALTDAAHLQALMDLGYVIPPMGANCGAGALDTTDAASIARTASFLGYDANNNGDFTDAGDIPPTNSIPADVAVGYSDLLTKFVAAYGDPGMVDSKGTAGDLQAAQKALADAIEAGQSGAALTPLQNAVTRAQEAHTKAQAAFNNVAGGPIYQAGVAEWMAKAAVTNSIDAYNKQVVKINMAKMTLDDMDFSMYVPLGNPELITTVVTGLNDADPDNDTVVLSTLIGYTNGDLANPQVGTVGMAGMGTTAATPAVVTDSNFDAAGNLIVPDALDTTDNTKSVPLLDTSEHGVDQIRTRVERVNRAAELLKKARDENVGLNQAIYDEAYRRAKAEADYYNEHWAKVLADTTDIRTDAQKLTFVDANGNGVRDQGEIDNTDYQANPITIARRYAEYTTESNKRFTAEQSLREAVATREAATAEVQKQFTSPQSFYAQLVSRRMDLLGSANRAVAGASEDGETPAKSLTDAAAAAQKALDEAQMAQAEFAALFENEEDPTVALINELIKTGGDDGQALVDAISATYDVAAGAEDAAREAVDELTGEGGAVAMNTAAISENADGIMELDGRVTQNEDDIASNTTMIGENRGMIMTNAENIAGNTTMIGENRGMIETNAESIMTNAGHIMENRGMIEMNSAGISSNADAIAANMNSIGQNSSAISDNRNMIGELSEDLDIVRAGVAASMALAGMPAINGRGISIGVGSFDGESAFAVGFQIQGEMASFKVGVTSASGATGASAGVGFQF